MKLTDIKQNGDTEARILAAAEHEFMTRGYAGARTTAIAEAAGVTHAMLHYYFRTKERLFDRILTSKISEVRDLINQSVIQSEGSVTDKICNVIQLHLDFLDANPELPRFLVQEVFGNPERLERFKQQVLPVVPAMFDNFQTQLDDAAERGEICHIDATMLLMDIVSLNVFPFLIKNAAMQILPDPTMRNHAAFLESRKQENIAVILKRLQPDTTSCNY